MNAPDERRSQLEARYQAGLARARTLSDELAGPSLAEVFARLPRRDREDIIAKLDTTELARLALHWETWATPKQLAENVPPHLVLLWMGGRGLGKSKSAIERVRRRVYLGSEHIGLIGPTVAEAERYMLGAEEHIDGLLNAFHPRHAPRYLGQPKNTVIFHTGAIGYVQSAESPEFRGPNLDTAWADEPIKWRKLTTLWPNILNAVRSASLTNEILVTTTARNLAWLKEQIAELDTVTILGTSAENPHLDPNYYDRMNRKLGGTRLGQQELEGVILNDNEGALFHASIIDATRVESEPETLRKVIAVDPAIATGARNDPTGIIGMGDDIDGDIYVFADRTGRHSAEAWTRIVVDMYDAHHAVAIVVERNRGGDLVVSSIRAAMYKKRGGVAADALKIVTVNSRRGKDIRAEPVSVLHERGRLHFVGRNLVECETEITEWDPHAGGPSPNRLDALVHGAWFLGNLGDDAKPDNRAMMQGLGALTAAAARSRPSVPKTTAPPLVTGRAIGRASYGGARGRRAL